MRRLIFLFLLPLSVMMAAQEPAGNSVLVKPSDGKCMVYIARRNTGAILLKFSIYDGETFLGKLGDNKYYAYECDPGFHVFIARSENTSYMEAELEAGRTYVIDVYTKMGVAITRVGLSSLNVGHKKYEKEREKFLKFIGKKKGELLISAENIDGEPDDEPENTPTKRMQKYREMKEKEKKMAAVSADMYFE